MPETINGIHHITAVCGPARDNYAFYTEELGMRFTKRTVNFDDPFTYHLYYGNYDATPGSAITFFPWSNVVQGSPSAGEATVVSYAVPKDAIGYWKERLESRGHDLEGPVDLFGYQTLRLRDHDGMKLELSADPEVNDFSTKGYAGVPDQHAIRGFFGTTLSLPDIGRTAELLEEFGWKQDGEGANRTRYRSKPENGLGTVVDLIAEPGLAGRFGKGSVHHVAFRVPDDKAQIEWRETLITLGFDVSPVRNRQYFRSIYFREPGGVLFEFATDGPGFTVDEPLEELGSSLQIPPWYEEHRQQIEEKLPPLEKQLLKP